MKYPFSISCHKCAAELVVSQPVARGRCTRCGTMIDLLNAHAVDPTGSDDTRAAANSGCESAVVDESTSVAACGDEVELNPTGRRRWLISAMLIACGVVLTACTYLYWPRQPQPHVGTQDIVVAIPDDKPAQVISPPPVDSVVVDEPAKDFDGTGEGVLDSLLLGSLHSASSWLTGLAATANELHTSTVTDAGNLSQVRLFSNQSTLATSQGDSYFSLSWQDYGPLSVGPPTFGYERVPVPNVKGELLTTAQEKITASGLVFDVVVSNMDTESIDPETDVVIQHKPAIGHVKHHSAIVITAIGRRVPNLQNLSLAEAALAVKNAGFQPVYDESVKTKWTVFIQWPPANSVQEVNTEVLFLSVTDMPYVEELPISEAMNMLEEQFIDYTWLRNYNPTTYPDDVICGQSIPAGEKVIRGQVQFHIERGIFRPAPRGYLPPILTPGVRVPDLIGATEITADRQLRRLGIEAVPKRQEIEQGQPEKRYVTNFGVAPQDRTARFGLAVMVNQPQTILAQNRDPELPVRRYQDVLVREDSEPIGEATVIDQMPEGGNVLCRGRRERMTLLLQQPVRRIQYYRQVPVQQQENGGGGGGGGGFF